MESRIEAARAFSSPGEEKARIKTLRAEFPLKIEEEELKYISSQTFYKEVCYDIGPWVARVLEVPDCGKLKVLCNQEDVPFSTDEIECVNTTLIPSERSFHFPELKTQHLHYFDVFYEVCQQPSIRLLAAFEDNSESDEDGPPLRPKTIACGAHGCAGYFRGDTAIVFDGADWLGKSPAVSKRLKDYFSDNGFNLKIINKVYQTVLGNCAMFSAVCVFLMLVHGEEKFFNYMDNVSDTEKNRLVESTAIKIREKAVPLLFNLTLFFGDGSTMQISCDENAKTRTSRDALKRKAVRIVVPKGVTAIAPKAFEECNSLVSITLPKEIRTIEKFAFSDCSSLASITLPDRLTTIGGFAFHECNSLAAITFPEGIRTIEEFAFGECYRLEAITLPRGIRTIEQYAFVRCTALVSITLPEGITTIERGIFEDTALVSATIPKTVTVIGEDAFRETNLASITLPEGLTTIDSGAFYYCYRLASINIPKSVTRIGAHAFYRCDSFESFTIPGGVTTIEEQTFQECSSLASINISEGVKTIEAGAFRGCLKLKSVSLPSTLKEITGGLFDDEPNGAFQECTLLDSVTLPKGMTTIGDFAFYNCKSLASVSIPEGVTTIGARVFEGCTNLKSIIFPSSVREFGQDILAGCTSLQRIYYAARDTERQADFVGVPRSVTTYLELSYDQAVEHDLAEVGASKRKLGESNEPSTKRPRTSGALYAWTRGER